MLSAMLKATIPYIGCGFRWILGGRKKPFQFYIDNALPLDYFIGLLFIALIAIALLGFPTVKAVN